MAHAAAVDPTESSVERRRRRAPSSPRSAPLHEHDRRTAAIVANRASGSVEETTLAQLRASLDHFKGPKILSFDAVAPDQLADATRAALKDEPDMVIVAGGDGAARTVAEVAAESSTPIAPLPYGTMNILPRRLYGDRTGPEIVKTLARGRPAWLPAGRVNCRLFLLSAAVGFPVSAAQAREDLRSDAFGGLADAMNDALRTVAGASERPIGLKADDGRARRASAVLLSTAQIDGLIGAPVDWLGAEEFDVITTDTHGVIDLARLGARLLADDWRDDEAVDQQMAKVVEVRVRGDAVVALDGDPETFDNRLRFTFERQGALVMLPPED